MLWTFAFLSVLSAIFAKIGIKDVNTDLATAIRAVVVLVLAWTVAFFSGIASSISSTQQA